MDTIIRETLRPFGITRNYRGYPQTVRAIALVLEDESRLLNVTEEIYEVVALQTRCHPSNVERNIRTVVLCAWHYKPTASGQNGGIYADGSAPRLPVY